MKPVVLIVSYLLVGALGIAGATWWQARARVASVAAVVRAAASFDYPLVVPGPGADPADWKAGHLDGWKWCVQHIRDDMVARDDADLRGFCPPDVNRTAAFLAGYHAARERFDRLVASDGIDAARAAVLLQLRTKPRINDLNVVALPP